MSCSSKRINREITSEKNEEINNEEKALNSNWTKLSITKEFCEEHSLPNAPFSIQYPPNYTLKLNPKPKSAFELTYKENGKIVSVIAIGITELVVKYSEEEESLMLQEFKEMPEIKNNPDFSVEILKNLRVLSENRQAYLMKLNNESGKYPNYLPNNTIGITFPRKDGWLVLSIVVSKYEIDKNTPLTIEELEILNTIKFE